MTHGSLFSGIGGFDLAAEWMGWENVFHCENNKFCQKILKYHFPNSVLHEDITKTDFSQWRGKIDVVTGGFPCQPYSQAGKRKGKADDRHLWPEMLRVVREIKPNWIVAENVYGIVNWKRGLVFEEVLSDLENEGYFTQAYILPACGKNAPHRRDRAWFIANSKQKRRNGNEFKIDTNERHNAQHDTRENDASWFITDTKTKRLQERHAKQIRDEAYAAIERYGGIPQWENFPTLSPVRGGNDGLPPGLVKQCLEALGNAIVPQIAYEIFKAIEMLNSDTEDKRSIATEAK